MCTLQTGTVSVWGAGDTPEAAALKELRLRYGS